PRCVRCPRCAQTPDAVHHLSALMAIAAIEEDASALLTGTKSNALRTPQPALQPVQRCDCDLSRCHSPHPLLAKLANSSCRFAPISRLSDRSLIADEQSVSKR